MKPTKKLLYIFLCQVVVDAIIYNVGFKINGFRSPQLEEEGLVDIEAIAEEEKEVLEAMLKEASKKSPNLDKLDEMQTECRLPMFLSGYVEAGQKSTLIFDILDDREYERAVEDLARAKEDAAQEAAQPVENSSESLEELKKLKAEIAAEKKELLDLKAELTAFMDQGKE